MVHTIKKVALALGPAVLLLPVMALAVNVQPLPSNVTSLNDLSDKVCLVAQWLFTFLIILAVIFVVVAAFRYLFAQGDPEKIKTANHAIIYAVVAVVVAVLAKGVPSIVGAFFTSGTFTGC
jgi:uncharacterized membrane protein YidH (DUF202 family)